MQEKLEELKNEVEALITDEDDRARAESMGKIACDIAVLALQYFTGDLLRKALYIAITVVEFANALEDHNGD